MSSQSEIEKIKQLIEITGVGFKDCKTAIDETKGDIDKAIDFLRKKGISKANKKWKELPPMVWCPFLKKIQIMEW